LGVLAKRGSIRPSRRVHWGGVAAVIATALILGGASGMLARHYLNERSAAAPLPGVTAVHAEPLVPVVVGQGTLPTPVALPGNVLLQVPFTTQAPLNNWAQHQESCEAATLSMPL